MEIYGRWTYRGIRDCLRSQGMVPEHFLTERGAAQPDTAVTENQGNLLNLAVAATEKLGAPIVEIGSYRGVSTQRLAAATRREVYAVDPFIGYGGWETDMAAFQSRTSSVSTIKHLRMTSGQAFRQLRAERFSLVFVDAVHDFANTWFDYSVWRSLLVPGGMIALHDVDDFPGSNLACRRALSLGQGASVWGYCPNLIIFRFSGSGEGRDS